MYRIREGQLEQLSRDHSVVADLIVAGDITAGQAETHPDRGVITRAIGAVDDLEVDIEHITTIIGDRFLICSDGLTDELSDAEIMTIASPEAAASSVAQMLLDRALESGGHDNVSIVVVDVVSDVTSKALNHTTRRRRRGLRAWARQDQRSCS